jgi:hypothetical protein
MVNERGKYQMDNWLLIIPLVFSSFIDHCIIWSSLLYDFWVSLWYFPLSLTIVSAGLLCFMASDYLFGIFLFHWSLYHLVFFALWLLIISLVFSSFIDHCIIWSSLLYGFWLSLWYFPPSLTIVSSGLLCFMTSDYPFGISLFHWPLDNQKP